MRVSATLITLASAVTGLSIPRSESNDTSEARVVPAQFDGHCFYPTPDPGFQLDDYLGTWYQVAGTPFGPTAGARCVTAEYSLNDNGTVKVVNTARIGEQPISIEGTAAPAGQQYGSDGVFQVSFPGQPTTPCPGPNYIVQEYCGDHAIVQTQNWTTLYILSRDRQPETTVIDSWISQAVRLGSNASAISKFNQTGC
ncbi:Calycin-like protein [Corynespora cassiicola Philippines]|uniref:Calycin-like protein n=1 Tax=Corynespora cassiicola Philippines TaxID=1448308 RepID=A0A2T2P3Q5_CORCC|nr:Calycin-like protein [Corynespora cassiicola Philippines]